MTSSPLNVFQKLMRRWDEVHPYNAAQVMQLVGVPDADIWESAWLSALADTGLGKVSLKQNRYSFVSLNGHGRDYSVQFPNLPLEDHISNEMNRPFDDPEEPPFRPFIIRAKGHFYAGLVYQHWLADSASIRLLIREWFLRVYDLPRAHKRKLRLAAHGYWKTIGPARSGSGLTQSMLDLIRRHVRLRRVQKIDSTALNIHATRFQLVHARAGLIDELRVTARHRRVKVSDIFLACLVESCAEHVPLQPRRNRTDVAVGSVMDLRPYAPKTVDQIFGVFLGFSTVICRPDEMRDFNCILDCISKQTQMQKRAGIAPASLMWMSAAMFIGKLSTPNKLYHFYRKELPLAGGLSNVDLTRTWTAGYRPAPLMDYIRISPTGPMTPLVLATTTLGDQFQIGMTYRTGLISAERAAKVAGTFLARLESLV